MHAGHVVLVHAIIFHALVAASTPPPRRINVALHAQSRFGEHGWVAGSEVTTAGLKRALLARTDAVGAVEVFAPFVYSALGDREWDLVLIEGWTPSVPSFIHAVRRASPRAVVLQYVVDTRWMERVAALDVDGYLTNARSMLRRLARVAPTRHAQLAADAAAFRPVPPVPKYRASVAYLGARSASKQPELDAMLRAVADAAPGLAIYGMYWDEAPDAALRARWKGVLPLEDIAPLYSSVDVVLGMTEPEQRAEGMINNRVFEALACGAALVTDRFPALTSAFGDVPLYYDTAREAALHVRRLLDHPDERASKRRAGPALIAGTHTWHERVGAVLEFYDELRTTAARPNAPTLLVVSGEGGGAGGTAERGLDLTRLWQALLLLAQRRTFDVRPVIGNGAGSSADVVVAAVLRTTTAADIARPVVLYATRRCSGARAAAASAPSDNDDNVTRVLVLPEACGAHRRGGMDVLVEMVEEAAAAAEEEETAAEETAAVADSAMHLTVSAAHDAAALADALADAIGRAQYGGEWSATSVTVVAPRADDAALNASPSGSAQLTVAVALRGFRTPEHGCWCIVVDGETVACEGDASTTHTITLTQSLVKSTACSSGDGVVTVSVHADVRSHLSNYAVVRSSTPVAVRLAGLCD